ncbi:MULTISPECIES: hypothetical protein [unclassified Crossiella]|uniref:hypothetical protein n=1 Tax=unclassified Crossiella TaxID=2620835 RepID=UPI001FFF3388|nr:MULTISPECIES: hypothetical protein [unclassified Crossiella]MCK2239275.1 hypothetical protein [Crossiella sp. S99.2]MCK2251155.1 hypothetical protein [Crossiella sp. S99.1]
MRLARLGSLFMTAAAAVALLTGAAGAATAGPAAASHSDGFEGDPWTRWEKGSEGDARAEGNYGQGTARTGRNNAFLWSAHGHSSVRLPINIASWPKSSCKASIWGNPVADAAHPGPRGAQVELQVWDPNGWRLLGTTAPWLNDGSYQRVITPPLDLNGVNKVYVQAIFGNNSGAGKFVRLDDMSFECS